VLKRNDPTRNENNGKKVSVSMDFIFLLIMVAITFYSIAVVMAF
jgi:hypothetical protein